MADRRSKRIFGVLDIGTSKIAAAVVLSESSTGGARVENDVPSLRLAGFGLQRSGGVKAGVLTDLDQAEAAVRAAVAQAERAAGVTIDGINVSVSCGRLKSQHFSAKANVDSGVCGDDDLQRVIDAGRAYAERDGRTLVHLSRLGYRLDGATAVRDPRGLAMRQVSAQLHAVTADEAPLRNLLLLVQRCYLRCDGLVATPYASALAATTPEEREIGVTCIDIGAGTTSIAEFADGKFAGAEVLAIGSQHVTFDIAKALQTPLIEAERLKTLYGTLLAAQSDEHELFTYALAGREAGETYQASKAHLASIIRPRLAQICALIRERLAQSAAANYTGDRVVLTGGSSQLLGVADFAANALGRPVRLAGPVDVPGLTQSLSGPQFATLAGMAIAIAAGDGEISSDHSQQRVTQSYINRVGSWLKTGF